ncbi:MAG: STAS domain-containing protein [Nitrosomonas sp.]|nr:MAG: STAS domain-containing protein [Nitrosomonas sp.]
MASNSDTVIRCANGRIIVDGAVTIDNVVMLTQQGIALFDDSVVIVDLEKIIEVDSAVISMLLEWLRTARKNSRSLHYINLPESVESLIQLYGVTEIIPVSRK